MTNDERKELVRDLQNYRPPKKVHPAYGTALHAIAAEEIVELEKRNDGLRFELDCANARKQTV